MGSLESLITPVGVCLAKCISRHYCRPPPPPQRSLVIFILGLNKTSLNFVSQLDGVDFVKNHLESFSLSGFPPNQANGTFVVPSAACERRCILRFINHFEIYRVHLSVRKILFCKKQRSRLLAVDTPSIILKKKKKNTNVFIICNNLIMNKRVYLGILLRTNKRKHKNIFEY